MQRARVKQRRSRRAKATAFVEIVESDNPLLAIFGFVLEQTHGNTHPEKLRRFQATRLRTRFVDDQITVIHRLHAEIIEIEVGTGIQGIGEGIDLIFLQQLRVNALDRNAVREVASERIAVSGFDASNAIAQDIPAQHFFVNVREQNATSEFREIGILFNHRASIENDRLLEIIGRNFRTDRATQLAFDFIFRKAQIQTDRSKGNALLEISSVPESRLTVLVGDHDHRLLIDVLHHFLLLTAIARAFEAIRHISTHGLQVTGATQLFLDHVLHVLDVDKSLFASAHTLGHRLGDFQ